MNKSQVFLLFLVIAGCCHIPHNNGTISMFLPLYYYEREFGHTESCSMYVDPNKLDEQTIYIFPTVQHHYVKIAVWRPGKPDLPAFFIPPSNVFLKQGLFDSNYLWPSPLSEHVPFIEKRRTSFFPLWSSKSTAGGTEGNKSYTCRILYLYRREKTETLHSISSSHNFLCGLYGYERAADNSKKVYLFWIPIVSTDGK